MSNPQAARVVIDGKNIALVRRYCLRFLKSRKWQRPYRPSKSKRSIWAYNWSNGNGPLLFIAQEWNAGGMSGITLNTIWLHEHDANQPGDERELLHIRDWLQDEGHLARLVADGTVRRVGELPILAPDTRTPRPRT